MPRLPRIPSQGVTRKVYAKAYDLAHAGGDVPSVKGGSKVSMSSGREYAKGKATEYKTVDWRGTYDEPQITGLVTGLTRPKRKK